MKNILKSNLIVAFALCSIVFAQLNNEGTSAATFLKIGIGARSLGMGSACVADINDFTALYWNPSGISSIEGKQVGFAQVDWIADVKLQFIGAVFPLKNGSMGVSATYLSMDEMKVTNWEHPEGTGETFNSSDLVLGVTYARQITSKFSAGIQGKYIQESISHSSASAFAIDVGTQYLTGFKSLKIGMAFTNYGSKMTMEGRDLRTRVDPYPTEGSNPDDVLTNLETVAWSLPMTFRLGISMDLLNNDFVRCTGNIDFNKERDYEQRFFGGTELAFLNEMVFLRGGISTRYDNEYYYSVGAGLKYSIADAYALTIDYAYTDMGIINKANRFTFGINF